MTLSFGYSVSAGRTASGRGVGVGRPVGVLDVQHEERAVRGGEDDGVCNADALEVPRFCAEPALGRHVPGQEGFLQKLRADAGEDAVNVGGGNRDFLRGEFLCGELGVGESRALQLKPEEGVGARVRA